MMNAYFMIINLKKLYLLFPHQLKTDEENLTFFASIEILYYKSNIFYSHTQHLSIYSKSTSGSSHMQKDSLFVLI